MNIKSQAFEISKPVSVEWVAFGDVLRDVQYTTWKSYNTAIQMFWDYQQFSYGYRERFGANLKFSELGTGRNSQTTDIYARLTSDYPQVSSKILDSVIQDAQARFKTLLPEILRGSVSVPSYKRDVPIPVAAQSIRLNREGKDRLVTLSLLSRASGKPTQYTVAVRAKDSSAAVFDRLLSGEYALGGSKILRKGSKWYVSLAYKFESKPLELDPLRRMGVDVGVVKAAALAFNFTEERYFIEGDEINAFRSRVEVRRNALLRQGKYCGESRNGHGTVRHLAPIEKLRGKVENFRNTTNHRYAKFIVDMAVKNGCGTIIIEDLTGISANDRFLKRWPYYDLQTKIAQKAAERGVTIEKISPKYTSQRCSCCGHIADVSRKTQAAFECVACGFKTNADYNAARNIATPRIEQIIAEELRRTKDCAKFA